VNHGTAANIIDRLKKMCPFLDGILFTVGDVDIQEMGDDDLEKAGLRRLKKG
jgi:hypothetical protein